MGIFATVSAYLTKLPASDAAPGINAGVSFAVLELALLAERCNELVGGMRALRSGKGHFAASIAQLEALALA